MPDPNQNESEGSFFFSVEDRIHPLFFPFDSRDPFRECLICQCDLMQCEHYLIEKGLKGNDVLFEIAICLSCAEKMQKELSKESLERIQAKMQEIDYGQRIQRLQGRKMEDLDAFIGHCAYSGEPIAPGEEHHIYALCSGDKMHYGLYPMALSGQIIEEIQDLLSEKTRDALDDFMNDYLIPDDLRDILKRNPVLV